MSDQPFIVPCDGSASASPVPATNRATQAILSPQAGVVALGSDYSSTAKAQIPKVDASGNQFQIPVNPAGGSAQVYAGQPPGALTAQYGTAVLGRMDSPTPSTWQPIGLDMAGSANVHLKSKVTFRAIAASVTAASNKSLIALVNNSSMVMRINEIFIYVPPGGGQTGLLGGSVQTYYPFICELRRITSYTGGTAVACVSGDTADTLASGVTVATGATPGTTVNTFWRADAQCQTVTGVPFYARGDYNEKTMVIRPGEGMTVTEISNGTINNAAGNGTTTASVDVVLVFTQAIA